MLSVFLYQTFKPESSFLATTNIKPITSSEALDYQPLNDLGFFKVTRDGLLNLYIEKLDQRTIFKEAISDYELLDRENFEDEQTFNDAVEKLAASIEIFRDKEKNWSIIYEYDDQNKWEQLLNYVDLTVSQNVRITLQEQFENSLAAAKQKRNFDLEDIDIEIKNALIDYERESSDRLFYLKEQALIARKLGVANNSIEAQTFGKLNSMITNLKIETPYYLRGYESIEKEIELIESRINTKPFVQGLRALEQQQRTINQFSTLYRAEILFKKTPINSDGRFSAASMKILTTDYERGSNKRNLMLALAALTSGIISSFYVAVIEFLAQA